MLLQIVVFPTFVKRFILYLSLFFCSLNRAEEIQYETYTGRF